MAVGLLAALAHSLVSPRHLVAHSAVLLPSSPANGDGASTRDMGTEERIATSSPVLSKAIKTAGVHLTVDELRHQVAASASTASLLDIEVEDTSASRAISLSNAVARAYVDYSKQLAAQSGESQVRALQARASDLTSQLNTLQSQVTDQTDKVNSLPEGSAAAATASNELNTLEARVTSVSQDLNDVNQAIDTTRLNGSSQIDGLQVLESATRADGPSLIATALPFILAGLVAFAAGSVTAIWRDRRDDRARRRLDIAAAIGAPVLASLPARGAFELDPSADAYLSSESDEETLRQLERRLAEGGDPGTEFVVVVLSGDDAAIQVVRQLSEAAAHSGLDTAVFAPRARPSLDGLLVHPAELRSMEDKNPKIYDSRRAIRDAAPSADLAIVLLVTDGSTLELPRWSASLPAVLIVSAGFARPAQLATVSAMMRAASRPFAGAIVSNPDPRDPTSAWQAPSLDPQAVPTRITGVASGSVS